MEKKIEPKKIYIPSEKIVVRQIEDELIIVPIEAETFDAEFDHALYSLKDTGKAVWQKLEKKTSVTKICADLAHEYDAPLDIITRDVTDLLNELLEKGIVIES